MSLTSLLIISLGGAFVVIWLIQYVPLYKTVFRRPFSPRLLVCKLLAPFDAFITVFLTMGAWIGITAAVGGIGMMAFGVLTSFGLSMGVLLVRKFFVPRWEKQFNKMVEARERGII